MFTLFATKRQRRVAREEADYALDRHGERAAEVLREKAQKTRSFERRTIYRLAARDAAKRHAASPRS